MLLGSEFSFDLGIEQSLTRLELSPVTKSVLVKGFLLSFKFPGEESEFD